MEFSDGETGRLRRRAARYRQMAHISTDQRTIDALILSADECEEMAERVEMEKSEAARVLLQTALDADAKEAQPSSPAAGRVSGDQ